MPALYGRYIDDIILGPLDKGTNFEVLLKVFNSINSNIQFTLEVPNEKLNFLDLSIWAEEKKINYAWYTKDMHTGNSLRKDSFVPDHVKSNFVSNSINTVKNRCSTEEETKKALKKLDDRFRQNGFRITSKKQIGKNKNKKYKEAHKASNKTFLKLKFLSDGTNRKIRNLIKKYKIPANLVSVPNKPLYNCLKTEENKKEKHNECEVCEALPAKYNCSDRFLIYKFTCKICNDFYIGQTSRSFKLRFSEHKRAIAKKQAKSALAEHDHGPHGTFQGPKNNSIEDFDLDILDQCGDSLDTKLTEARFIKNLCPKINRKSELTAF